MWFLVVWLAGCGGELDQGRYADCERAGEMGWYWPVLSLASYDGSGLMVSYTEDYDGDGLPEWTWAWTHDDRGRVVEEVCARPHSESVRDTYTLRLTWTDDDDLLPGLIEEDVASDGRVEVREEIEQTAVTLHEDSDQPARAVYDRFQYRLVEGDFLPIQYYRQVLLLDEEGHMLRQEWDGGEEAQETTEYLVEYGWADGLYHYARTEAGSEVVSDPESEPSDVIEEYWSWDEDGFELTYEYLHDSWYWGLSRSLTTFAWSCPGGAR